MRSVSLCLWSILTGFIMFSGFIHGQENGIPGSIIPDLLEELSSTEQEPSEIEEITEDLSAFLEEPLDLNRAGTEDIKSLHVLNEFQIYTLQEYIINYGPVLSLNELNAIIGFTPDVIRNIEPFVCFGPEPVSIESQTGSIKQEFLVKFGTQLGKNKNYAPENVSESNHYLGKNRSIKTRYQIGSGSSLKGGITLEQDPGESFKPPGEPFRPDFISGFFEIRKKGFIDRLVIGDYKTSYGQGLVISDYAVRKGSTVLLRPVRTGIRKYSSTGENDFFRGVAASLSYHNLTADIFYSRMMRDATVYFDSCRFTRSLSSNGYHRTQKEIEKKDALLLSGIGTHVAYHSGRTEIGLTFFSQDLNADFISKTDPFSTSRFRKGEAIWNAGADYKMNLNKIIFFGELATDHAGKLASLNGLMAELHPLIHYSFIYRNYHRSYLGLEAGGFGEKSHTRNEKGYYTGLEIYPGKKIRIDIFADHYRIPFPDIYTTGPMAGKEYFMNCSYSPDLKTEMSVRTRFEKFQDTYERKSTGIEIMDSRQKLGNRFELKFAVFPGFVLKSRTEISHYKIADNKWTKGYYCGNDLSFESKKREYKLWLRYALFDIPSWENRIYAYENDVLYSFSTPAYYSSGSRIILMVKTVFLEQVEFWIRIAYTNYQGRYASGAGQQKNTLPSMAVQLRLKI